jgi:hypothetical protein
LKEFKVGIRYWFKVPVNRFIIYEVTRIEKEENRVFYKYIYDSENTVTKEESWASYSIAKEDTEYHGTKLENIIYDIDEALLRSK